MAAIRFRNFSTQLEFSCYINSLRGRLARRRRAGTVDSGQGCAHLYHFLAADLFAYRAHRRETFHRRLLQILPPLTI
jgi:hypothetical protein